MVSLFIHFLKFTCYKIHSNKRTTTIKIQAFPQILFVVSPCSTHGFFKQAPQAVLCSARDESHHLRASPEQQLSLVFCLRALVGELLELVAACCKD